MRRPRSILVHVSLVAAALVAAVACANQGQGDRCDKNNNNTDCSAGLVCTSASLLAPQGYLGVQRFAAPLPVNR